MRRRVGRIRLRRPALLARHIRLRHRPFLDRPDRLAGDAVEHVQPRRLGADDHHLTVAAVVADGGQLRGGARIEIPQVVVNELEVPQPLPRARLERDDGRPEQIAADAVHAVEVIRRRSERHVDDAAPRVDRHLAPVVHAADVLPGVLRPGVIAELARPRYGVEGPHQLAGQHVVGADVAGGRHVAFAGRAANDDEILEDLARDARLDVADALRLAAVEPDTQVDDTVGAERHDRLAGLRVDLLQQAVHREDQALVSPSALSQ